MSSYPCRPLKAGWNEELYQSSRLHAATFQINQSCVAGGVCYGYAHAADSKDSRALQMGIQRLDGHTYKHGRTSSGVLPLAPHAAKSPERILYTCHQPFSNC